MAEHGDNDPRRRRDRVQRRGGASRGRRHDGAEGRAKGRAAVDGFHAQALTFAARERVIFAAVHNERYYPYAVEVAAHDDAALLKADAGLPDLPATLRALGITAFESFHEPGLGATVFHHMVLPADELRLVEPVAASLVGPSGIAVDAAALFDRNDETTAGDRFDAASALVMDFGRPTRLSAARFVAPHPADYPAGYTLLASPNDRDWTEIQHVEDREPQACIYGNRICYRNRYAVMECRFEPTELRYLKVQGLRSAGAHFDVRRFPYRAWRFNEAYFYEQAGDGTRPDAREAAEIARELAQRGVELAVCDEWLSRKLETAPAPRPGVWPRYEYAHPQTHVERIVPIRPGVAVVVETAHAPEVERLLADATLGEVAFARHDFPHYTAYIVQSAPADYAAFPGLRWNGLTLVGTARIATADWYHRRGMRLEKAGQPAGAMRCFKRSFETFPGIRANLERLAPHDNLAKAQLEALTPQRKARCRFPHGVSLVGYTLTPSPLKPGRPATLRLVWELDGPVKHDFMQVFVHFVGGDRRLFQADHNAVFPVAAGSTVPPALVLDEHTFTVPPDVPPGDVTIRLGATAVSDRTIRLKPRTKLKTAERTARYFAPLAVRTTGMVLSRIPKSRASDQLSMYSRSSFIHSSKRRLLRPLICHRHVSPGFTLSLRRCQYLNLSISVCSIGRGPTKLISPLSTLKSWGSSSRLHFRSTRPSRVIRGSRSILKTTSSISFSTSSSALSCSAFDTIVRNL
jgi:hypothetical protein